MIKQLQLLAGKTLLSCCFLLFFALPAKAGNPYLVLNGADTIIIEQGDTFTDPGATAYDANNNVITGAKIAVSSSPFVNIYIPATYTLTYNYTDTAGGKAAAIKRIVIVLQDSTPPVLTILGQKYDTVEVYENYISPQAKAQDNVDGDISASIVIQNNVNTFVPGWYYVTYQVSDISNNKSPMDTVHVLVGDFTPPVITLRHKPNDTVTVGVFETYAADSGMATDNFDSSATVIMGGSFFSAFPNAKATMPGLYSIIYTAIDQSGNSSTVEIIIRVVDTIAPIIEITGPRTDTIALNSKYELRGHNVTDNYSYVSDITITMFGSYITTFQDMIATTEGTYTLGLKAVDKSGNVGYDSINIFVTGSQLTLSGDIKLGNISQSLNRNATVYLIKFDATDSTLTAVATYNIASGNGSSFLFNSLAPGDYLVKAALDSTDSLYADYLPTYYQGSLTWDKAQTISLKANTKITLALTKGTNTGGPGFISGKVTQGANKKEGDPLANIQMILTTADDKPVAYTYSDENGYFEFKTLALVSYILKGEIVGKHAIGKTYTLTEENKRHDDIMVLVNSTSVVIAANAGNNIEENRLNGNSIIYPNPASQNLYIHTAENTSLQQVKLYNTTGQLIISQKVNHAKNTVLDVSAYPQGIYILQLEYKDLPAESKKIVVAH